MTTKARLVEPNNQAFLLSGQGAFAREVLVHPSRAQKAEAPESLESMGSAWSIVESLDIMEDKKKAKV